MLYVLLLTGGFIAQASDTLKIEPCDEAVINLFDDIFTLSRSEGTLRRYQKGKLLNMYSGSNSANNIIIQEPVRPVLAGPDKIYLLDAANNRIIAWDRFLNLHSITSLHKDIISASEFTVTSEYDWLIYDDYHQVILQVFPNENYPHRWGDFAVSGDIELHRLGQEVLIYLKERKRVHISDNNGTTLMEYAVPDSLDVQRIFSLGRNVFGLSCESGIYIWEPQKEMCRYLSNMPEPVFMKRENKVYTLINRQGLIINIR